MPDPPPPSPPRDLGAAADALASPSPPAAALTRKRGPHGDDPRHRPSKSSRRESPHSPAASPPTPPGNQPEIYSRYKAGEPAWERSDQKKQATGAIDKSGGVHQDGEGDDFIEFCHELMTEDDKFATLALNFDKAWKIAQGIVDLQASSNLFSAIAEDDMVLLAERLLSAQRDFADRGIPSSVDVAYHHTRPENLATIRTVGLMSRSERVASNINSKHNGSVHGDGIYCASHPTAFAGGKYGEVGIMVARLKGREAPAPAKFDGNVNAVVVNASSAYRGFTLLEKSCQCLPMFQFDSGDVVPGGRGSWSCDEQAGLNKIASFQEKVQSLLDEHFNGGAATLPAVRWNARQAPPRRRWPAHRRRRLAWQSNVPFRSQQQVSGSRRTFQYQAPEVLSCPVRVPEASSRPAPVLEASSCPVAPYLTRPLLTHSDLSLACPICWDSLLKRKVVRMKNCSHNFHKACIDKALSHGPFCPTCRAPSSEPRGKMPTGTMTVDTSPSPCAGHEGLGRIVIRYSIPSGIQKQYHPNPSARHGAARRTAYLPDDVEGNRLLKRLVYAFGHGLTFTVGTGLTTGRPDSVTWSSIHHKTSDSGGVHGYPDPNYFFNCNADMDALHVPPADKL